VPSHVSEPVYVPAIRPSRRAAVALNSASHIGAGTSPPAGNFIDIVTEPPATVPVSVPLLTLWHEPHVPSLGATALISAVPEMAASDCVMSNVTSSGLNESDPVPVHIPVSEFPLAGTTGAGTTGVCGNDVGATGVGGDDIPPHATSQAASAPARTICVVLAGRFNSHAYTMETTGPGADSRSMAMPRHDAQRAQSDGGNHETPGSSEEGNRESSRKRQAHDAKE
jgi:hypothetical protein